LAGGLGRFIACDPLGLSPGVDRLGDPQNLHPYSYGGNNPLARTDPSGLDAKKWFSDVASGVWGYASEKVTGTVDYVVENPGKTVAMVVTAPVTGGAMALYGVGSTAYGAAEDLTEAITGDDFDSDGYKKLNDTERRQKVGRAIAQGVEVASDIAGAKKMETPKPPKKNYSPGAYAKTHHDTPAAHAKTYSDAPAAHAKTQPYANTQVDPKQIPNWSKSAQTWLIEQHNKFIMDRIQQRGGEVSIDELETIASKADQIWGPVALFLD
jgi:hypothetical protein